MVRSISAAEANRRFSALLRAVGQGETYVVTSHGRPVARITPAVHEAQVRAAARDRLLSRLESQPAAETGLTWTRAELYEDEGR